MKLVKIAALSSVLIGSLAIAVPASARPHRHQVCTTKWVHHHKVRRCHWR